MVNSAAQETVFPVMAQLRKWSSVDHALVIPENLIITVLPVMARPRNGAWSSMY